MIDIAAADPDWKAPSEEGALLVWPEPARLRDQVQQNHERLAAADSVRVQNLPLPELRKIARAEIGHLDNRPLIATGHQTELYHPGVWVKNAVVDALARATGGAGVHLAVNTDQVKHLHLRWPGRSLPASEDPRLLSAPWSAAVNAPSASHIESLQAAVREDFGRFNFDPMLHRWLDAFAAPAMNLSRAIGQANRDVDASLGLDNRTVFAADVWAGRAFATLAYHIAAHADRFAVDYNDALRAYRVATGGTDPNRPMPDLVTSDDAIELPLWLDDLENYTRSRPTVFREPDGQWTLQLVEDDRFEFDPNMDAALAVESLRAFLTRNHRRFAPRALTLTLFMRLCVVDEFVHGIGGARYDLVTDGLIRSHFDCDPPAYSVSTATLRFPTAAGRSPTCLPCLVHEGHRLRHEVLGDRKRSWLDEINRAPRGSLDRRRRFYEMHREMKQHAENHPRLQRWRDRMDQAIIRSKSEADEFSRELFFAVQPEARLRGLIDRVRETIG